MTAFVHRNQGPLLNTARSHGLAEDQAEEVVQATWEAFLRALARFEARSSIETFLFGILFHKLAEHRRYAKRFMFCCCDNITDVTDLDLWSSPAPTPERCAETSEMIDRLNNCLETLTGAQRAAFYLREIQGEDSAYICSSLGITSVNLGVLIHRAKHRLRSCLGHGS